MLQALALYMTLMLAWFVLAPGISGTFLFDDFPNLDKLGQISVQPGLESFLRYIFDVSSGGTGRPLSLASFALQHDSWQGHPGDFIRVNILLHLLNGALLFWCLQRLLRLTQYRGRPWLVALLATALWLLSPLQAGAVLYVVQRMAVLAGTFMLLGLLQYLHGRERVLRGQIGSGVAWMTSGLATGLGLGVLAKENAALFPLLLVVTEWTLLQKLHRPVPWKRWAAICLGLPIIALVAYLLYRLPGDLATTSYLGVTGTERLLTEPRILFMYLQKLLLPPLYGIRIMYDDLEVSSSLWSPWTTAPSIAAWMVLVGAGFVWRKKMPILSFGIFWFLANHLLESTFIPLEVAFDHRNYVAIAGVALAFASGLDFLVSHAAARRVRTPVIAAAAGYFAFLAAALWQTSSLWGTPREMIAYWEVKQPHSRRVSYEVAATHLRHHLPYQALRVYRQAFERWPGDTTLAYALLAQGCWLAEYEVPTVDRIHSSLSQYDGHVLTTVKFLNRIISLVEVGLCPRYRPDLLLNLVEMTYQIPALRHAQRTNYHLMVARLTYLNGNRAVALDHLDRAMQITPAPDILDWAIEWAIEAGDRDRVLGYLETAEAMISTRSPETWWFRERLARYREQIQSLEVPEQDLQ